jgi:hypothetical protein
VLRRDPTGSGYKLINLAEETLVTYSYQLLLNSLSLSLLGIRNEDWLSEARKTLYRAIKYLEDTVTPFVDVPFSDYEQKLDEIADFSADARYLLIRSWASPFRSWKRATGTTPSGSGPSWTSGPSSPRSPRISST